MSWQTLPLSELLDVLESGSRPKGGVRGIESGVPSVGGEHLNSCGGFDFTSVKYVPHEFAEKMRRGRIKHGDVLVVKDGATTGKTSFVGDNFPYQNAFVNEHVFICRPSQQIKPKYLFWYLFSDAGQKRILENFKGSAQGGINQEFAPNTLVPVAPMDQQRRIVAKLDQITARIDEAKARLDTIPATLKRFRQSILAAACSGRLTADWRKESGTSSGDDGEDVPGGWRKCPFNNVLQELRNGISRKPEITPSGVPILRISAVRPCRVILSDHRFLPAPTERELVASLQDGDLLFTRYNGNIEFVGVCGIVRGLDSRDMLYPDKLMRVRLKHDVSPEWVEIFFSSPDVRDAVTACSKSSAGQNGISGADIKNQPILVPSISEQTEIVRRVEALFKQADAIEARYKKARTFVEKLTPAVLAKAFRGELE